MASNPQQFSITQLVYLLIAAVLGGGSTAFGLQSGGTVALQSQINTLKDQVTEVRLEARGQSARTDQLQYRLNICERRIQEVSNR
jgi:ABC-type branched-subunit amino acid transport system permease subunit